MSLLLAGCKAPTAAASLRCPAQTPQQPQAPASEEEVLQLVAAGLVPPAVAAQVLAAAGRGPPQRPPPYPAAAGRDAAPAPAPAPPPAPRFLGGGQEGREREQHLPLSAFEQAQAFTPFGSGAPSRMLARLQAGSCLDAASCWFHVHRFAAGVPLALPLPLFTPSLPLPGLQWAAHPATAAPRRRPPPPGAPLPRSPAWPPPDAPRLAARPRNEAPRTAPAVGCPARTSRRSRSPPRRAGGPAAPPC